MKKIVFIIFSLSGCFSINTEKIAKLEKFTNVVSIDVFSFLPLKKTDIENSIAQIINYPDGFQYLHYSSLLEVFQYDENDFASKIAYLNEHKLVIYEGNDKCNLFIAKESQEVKASNICGSKYLPVPSITNKLDNLSRFVSLDSSEIYMLHFENSKNVFIDKNIISQCYTSGAIVDKEKRTIIYWVLIL